MFKCQGVILKGRMEIRLGGMPRISGLCKEAQIRDSQGVNQLLFFSDPAVVCLCSKDGINKEKESKDQTVYGNEKQV